MNEEQDYIPNSIVFGTTVSYEHPVTCLCAECVTKQREKILELEKKLAKFQTRLEFLEAGTQS